MDQSQFGTKPTGLVPFEPKVRSQTGRKIRLHFLANLQFNPSFSL